MTHNETFKAPTPRTIIVQWNASRRSRGVMVLARAIKRTSTREARRLAKKEIELGLTA